ncbi:NmrA-like family protein [Metarhizium robertsii]|uniref:Hscarg dehydrogenase n=2 Tax=Metarhizium robertsii TaxID=568076 RepID=E9F3D5_METRA|nr:hscarg dehydrogenase [Metarhizium robertsii ARSEF 23]EFY97672.1 hscarg dehydrogenase [Metarhizium robertsii ARSEF 23]EXV05177.1 NmrA-like family protein [Metarhizium robertsii]
MSKIFTVFGATGNQGGSVIRAVLADPVLSKEYKLRGVTRDVSKPAAQALTAKGVEMVKADMSSPEAAAPAVQGAHSVFMVTNFWESMSDKIEIAQGKAVTDASKAAGVKHLIFSSLINVTDASKGRLAHVTHFDGKAKIEQYIRGSGLQSTFVQPGLFMSGFFGFIRKQDDGSLAWAMPEGVKADQAQIPLFDAAADTGIFVKAALRSTADGRVIRAATDYYTPSRIVSEFEAVTGKKVAFREVPHEAFKAALPPAAAQELLENMLLLQEPGYYAGADLKDSLALLGQDKPTTWKAFVEENKAKWE